RTSPRPGPAAPRRRPDCSCRPTSHRTTAPAPVPPRDRPPGRQGNGSTPTSDSGRRVTDQDILGPERPLEKAAALALAANTPVDHGRCKGGIPMSNLPHPKSSIASSLRPLLGRWALICLLLGGLAVVNGGCKSRPN